MYKILKTTDNKYIGSTINKIDREIPFPDGFIMEVQYVKFTGDIIKLSNDNYIIIARKD